MLFRHNQHIPYQSQSAYSLCNLSVSEKLHIPVKQIKNIGKLGIRLIGLFVKLMLIVMPQRWTPRSTTTGLYIYICITSVFRGEFCYQS